MLAGLVHLVVAAARGRRDHEVQHRTVARPVLARRVGCERRLQAGEGERVDARTRGDARRHVDGIASPLEHGAERGQRPREVGGGAGGVARVDLAVVVAVDVLPLEPGAGGTRLVHAGAGSLDPARVATGIDGAAVGGGLRARERQRRLQHAPAHAREIELEIREGGQRLQADVEMRRRTVVPRRLRTGDERRVRDGCQVGGHRGVGTAAVQQATAGTRGTVAPVALLGRLVHDTVATPRAERTTAIGAARSGARRGVRAVALLRQLIDPTVATERRAGAVGRAAAGTRAVIGAVALLPWLVDDTVAAARRERLREGHAVADDAVGADHLQGQRATVDRHAREPERRLVVGREAALRLQRVEVVATAAARHVDRTLPRRDHLVGPQRERALVVVLVPHEHHVDAAGV